MMGGIRVYNIEKDKLDFNFNFHPNETNTLHNFLNNNTKPTINDIRRIALWKLSRVIDVPENILKMLGELATKKNLNYRDKISKTTIDALVKCNGVGFPMASTILKFLRPDVYPIIDVRAYRVLKGKKIYSSNYNLELYLNYVDELRSISNQTGIPFSEVDEQLYMFDKKHNKNIN